MNINCKKHIENLDNSEYYYKGCIQKMIKLQVVQHICCEVLIGGIKIVYTDMFIKATNIIIVFQNYLSWFEGDFTKWYQRNHL